MEAVRKSFHLSCFRYITLLQSILNFPLQTINKSEKMMVLLPAVRMLLGYFFLVFDNMLVEVQLIL